MSKKTEFWQTFDGHIYPNKGLAKAHENRILTGALIEEEMKTKKYPRKQAIAIGLSRARKVGIKV